MHQQKLSYHHLPSHLKRCFAYCAILPKAYEFQEKELVFLWMAEGLLQQSNGNKQPEDLGCQYFRDLLSRSIFQPANDNGSKFTMHDLINDLAQWVSGETCFRLEDQSEANKRPKRFQRIRYSSYTCDDCDGKNKLEVFGEVKCLRTFLPVLMHDDSYTRYISQMVLINLLPKFKKLRALSLRNYYITELPSSIGGLRHLRYLNLSDTAIKSLPESTNSLFNLQILILRGCIHLTKLPSNMGNLTKLRHLDITGVKLIEQMPLRMEQLKYLKTLSNFIVGKGTGSSLKDLKKLASLCGGLCISRLENVADPEDRSEAILSDKTDLDELMLEWGSHFDDSRDAAVEKNVLDMLQPPRNLKKLAIKCYGGARFSSWLEDSSFSNMVLLRLEGCENCTSLPSLGLLSSLKDLIIKDMRGLKSIRYEIYGEHNSKPFQSLESLCFEGMQEWEYWDPIKEDDDHVGRFPQLRNLSILKCPKLSGKLPDHLPSLEKLVIDKCGKLVISVSSFPRLCKLEVHGCKRMICRNEIDLSTLKSMTLSDVPNFTNWLVQRFQQVERLKIVDCEELMHLWQNEICLEKPPKGLHSLTSIRDLSIESCSRLVFFPEVCSLPILKKLKIRFCSALFSLPEGTDYYNTCLAHLRIEGCHSLTFIARSQLSSSLKKLEIYNCKQLLCIMDDREYSWSSSSSSVIDTSTPEKSAKCQLPTTLKHLHIQNCPELITLSAKEQLPQALEYFCIDSCSKLEVIAERFHNNSSLGQIVFYNCASLKSIPEGLHNLTRLQRILISGCPNIIFFPEGGLPNTNLSVSIQKCEKLKTLPNCLHSLSSLQQLTLRQCPSIISFPQEGLPTNLTSLKLEDVNVYKPLIEWGLHKLTSLRYLKITDPNALCFPPQEEMKMILPASLTHLIIVKFPKLKCLSSKGFQNLTCLERLTINDCPNLSSFPEVGLPSSLLQLYIYDCPLLKKHCKRDKGREWSKIAHVPCVKIDDRFIYDPEEEE
ncbi:NBS-LRR disease resistance protein NBS49 [Melia azedarach]|uniref:NBS-LRR disease resistance protein NBS49 n=1 Tax=Melia azedarach TaxID=155640 RepID=A0ACC1YPC8_MELAZ|nr:NBS-LRR disease resistance protein NBS49 [Melia azedarach]